MSPCRKRCLPAAGRRHDVGARCPATRPRPRRGRDTAPGQSGLPGPALPSRTGAEPQASALEHVSLLDPHADGVPTVSAAGVRLCSATCGEAGRPAPLQRPRGLSSRGRSAVNYPGPFRGMVCGCECPSWWAWARTPMLAAVLFRARMSKAGGRYL